MVNISSREPNAADSDAGGDAHTVRTVAAENHGSSSCAPNIGQGMLLPRHMSDLMLLIITSKFAELVEPCAVPTDVPANCEAGRNKANCEAGKSKFAYI